MDSDVWIIGCVSLSAMFYIAMSPGFSWGDEGLLRSEVKGRLNITFTIVDKRGSLVDDVDVDMEWRNLSHMPSFVETPANTSEHTVDGTFVVGLDDVSWIRVSFTKHGYLPEEWQYSFLTESVNDPSLENGMPPSKVTIVLKERPELADMDYREEVLHCDVGAPGELSMNRYLLFGEIAPPRLAGSSNSPGAEVLASLLLDCEIGRSGRVQGRRYVFDRTSRIVDYFGVERSELTLLGGGEGDGLQVVPLAPKYHREPLASVAAAEILEAPESGYSPTIELREGYGEYYLFFVIRVHGVYGKGYLQAHPLIKRNEPEGGAYAKVKVWINPTGSRNVATPRY
jgi:hypothetical protein